MATRSPTPTHNYWGTANAAGTPWLVSTLPNVGGTPPANPAPTLQSGDTAFIVATSQMLVCAVAGSPTTGGAVWLVLVTEFNPNLVPGLLLDLDARDVAPGPITSWTDRQNGYVLTGTATRALSMNGLPSVNFNGGLDILRTTGLPITGLNGGTEVTMFLLSRDFGISAFQTWPMGLANEAPPVPYPGPFVFANVWSGFTGSEWRLLNQLYVTASNAQYIVQQATQPGILTQIKKIDTAAATETSIIRYNAASPAVLPTGFVSENTGVFPDFDVLLGRYSGVGTLPDTFPWLGAITKVLVYDRALTAAEMFYVERGIAPLGGIVL